jgi:hypothetical protein
LEQLRKLLTSRRQSRAAARPLGEEQAEFSAS